MASDVFFAGVEPGGLYTAQEIKILICYMLNGVGEPLPLQTVTDVLAGRGMANFFEVSAAVEELLRRHQITEDEQGCLSLTDTGRQTASTLATMVPLTLRERSVQAALQLLTRQRRERENAVDIRQLEHGYQVTCSMHDGDQPLMSLSLTVGDDLQAALVKDRFLDDPTLLYRSLIAVLTGDVQPSKNGKEITFHMP